MQEGKNKLIKATVILAISLVAILIIIAISQTFIIKGLTKTNNTLESKNDQIEQNIKDIDKEIEARESQDFKDEYLETEEGFGKEGDIILKPSK